MATKKLGCLEVKSLHLSSGHLLWLVCKMKQTREKVDEERDHMRSTINEYIVVNSNPKDRLVKETITELFRESRDVRDRISLRIEGRKRS